jgi:transposase
MIGYKVADTGGLIVYVDPHGAIRNALRGGRRWHSCNCGAEMHRDIASVKAVHIRAFVLEARSGPRKLFEAVAA